MAVPAALAVAFFEPLVLLGLGVAPAPWGFLVFTGIIPEAAEHSGHGSGAAAVIAGFLAMMLMPNVLQEGGQGPAGSADRGRCRLE
ncbi:MAG: hypothetical protein QN130_14680 [Armatimonadota bacterium]|nr:hypothetical protein [Armatimonadota bacterium]